MKKKYIGRRTSEMLINCNTSRIYNNNTDVELRCIQGDQNTCWKNHENNSYFYTI